ncbi:MAG: curli production assembly/transport component CsgG [Calditrichaeota bacterium]|nr:MAG: curli production assembly/transport component CsgG [Calditrichota bacterium]
MNHRIPQIYIVLSSFTCSLFFGCAAQFSPLKTKPAQLGTRSQLSQEFEKLPDPAEKIVAAVYKFRDQTGQYKSSSSGASWSTAVTQGATSILLRALGESNWFLPIEREGLSNLLNERKIIRSSRANYAGASGEKLPPLPPLLYAGIIMEGGIVSYDSNVLTGGAGARYFGLGASGEYQQDRVTIYLRAISTQNGRILKTVYTTKTILSQVIDVGLYRFVKFKKLLEAETGFSYNEPKEMCVTEAIEKAVYSLVIEGILDGLWTIKNPQDRELPVFSEYQQEKQNSSRQDYFGETVRTRRGKFGLGFQLAPQKYSGDYSDSKVRLSGEISSQIRLTSALALSLNLGRGSLADERYFTTTFNFGEIRALYYFYPNYRFTPFIVAGTGILKFNSDDKYARTLTLENDIGASVMVGLGFEYLMMDHLGINILVDNHYTTTDELDGLIRGDLHDYFWGFRFALKVYR